MDSLAFPLIFRTSPAFSRCSGEQCSKICLVYPSGHALSSGGFRLQSSPLNEDKVINPCTCVNGGTIKKYRKQNLLPPLAAEVADDVSRRSSDRPQNKN